MPAEELLWDMMPDTTARGLHVTFYPINCIDVV